MKSIFILLAVFSFCAARCYSSTEVSGQVSFEKLVVDGSGLKLDEIRIVESPGVKVELVSRQTGKIVGVSETDVNGRYKIQAEVSESITCVVRVLAQCGLMRVENFEDTPSLYSVVGPEFTLVPNSVYVQNVLAIDRDSKRSINRGSGPFNILAVLYKMNMLLFEADPHINIPQIRIKWSPEYVGGTFFGVDNIACVNGRRSEDSDEFDDHIIMHEYGHFLAANFSRLDGPNGPHTFHDELDPRLAWSEGWANFISCVGLNDPHYLDSGATPNGLLISADFEDNHNSGRPGYWNEHCVASSLWDLYDEHMDDGDDVAIAFSEIWKAFTGDFRMRDFMYLVNFCDELVRLNPSLSNAVEANLQRRSIAYKASNIPTVDNPFPTPLVSGTPASGILNATLCNYFNRYGASSYFFFNKVTSSEVMITLNILPPPGPLEKRIGSNLDLYLYRMGLDGELVASSTRPDGVGSREEILSNLSAGFYVIEVRGWSSYDSGGRIKGPQHASYTLTATF